MCMKYRAICFDFDYTLGDSTDSIVAGFQYGFTRLGWPAPDRETVRRTVGYLLEDAYTLLTGDRDPEHRAAFRPLFLEASMERQRRQDQQFQRQPLFAGHTGAPPASHPLHARALAPPESTSATPRWKLAHSAFFSASSSRPFRVSR